MTDDYKNGLITGLAMQPLSVTTETAPHGGGDNMCGQSVTLGILTDDCQCAMITYD